MTDLQGVLNLIPGAEIKMWCSFCNAEEATGELEIEEENVESGFITLPIGYNCLVRLRLDNQEGVVLE